MSLLLLHRFYLMGYSALLRTKVKDYPQFLEDSPSTKSNFYLSSRYYERDNGNKKHCNLNLRVMNFQTEPLPIQCLSYFLKHFF